MSAEEIAAGFQNLSPDQVSILLRTMGEDLREIKDSIGPIRTWKDRVQGALTLIGVCIALIGGAVGYGLYQADGVRIDMVHVKDKLDDEEKNKTVEENQIAIVRGDIQTALGLAKPVQDNTQMISELKAQIKLDETNGILNAPAKKR